MKDERERGAILSDKLETAEVELSERLETIEALKMEMAKQGDVAEKSKGMDFCVHKVMKLVPKIIQFFSNHGLKCYRKCAKKLYHSLGLVDFAVGLQSPSGFYHSLAQ